MTEAESDSVATAAPIARTERMDVLDIIRGFALLGILLMNIEWFSRPVVEIGLGLDPAARGADHWAGWLIYAFVQGKFYTMFSMLFGMGFVVFLVRADRSGRDGSRLFARRLVVLLLIGVAHGILLWPGDILTMYAVVGLSLLLFRNSQPRQLLRLSMALFCVLPFLLMPLMQVGLSMDAMMREQAANPELLAKLDESRRESIEAHVKTESERDKTFRQAAEYAAVYAQGGYIEVTRVRATEFAHSLPMIIFAGPSVLSMFLLGAWFVRTGAIHDPAANRRLFVRLCGFGLGLGIPLALGSTSLVGTGNMFTLGWSGTLGMILMQIANVLLCLGYVGALVLLWLQASTRRIVGVLAPAGRMALTNYLGHSLVLSTLFYGYGAGWFGHVGRFDQVGIALALYACQLILSAIWLRWFRYGPMEWLWRSATYGRMQPMRLQ